jgi:hypothetical protein
MFFSNFAAETDERLIREAGFAIEHATVVEQDNEDARFLWIVARVAKASVSARAEPSTSA